ncbi:MAG: hypothetical protein IJW45_04500 [Oscillospiraceae bacterium]|nr:hypothetical protein [Oscillospiraceae bacterium]
MKKHLCALLAALLTLSFTGCTQDAQDVPTDPTASTAPPAAAAPDPYIRLQRHVTYHDAQGISHILIDGTVLPTTLENVTSVRQSLDGSRAALSTRDGDAWLLTGDQLTLIAQDVTAPALSVSGDGLAYFTPSGSGYALMRYDCATGAAATVTTDTVRALVLSPDGGHIAYTTTDGQLFLDDTALSTAPDTLLGMDDSGNIYSAIQDPDGYRLTYHTASGTLDLGAMDTPAAYFDRDHRQLLFYRDGCTFITDQGGTPAQICPGTATALLPPGTAPSSNGTVTTLPVTDLYSLIYTSTQDGTSKLWRPRQGGQTTTLSSNATFPTLDATGAYVYYLQDGSKLCSLRLSDGSTISYATGVQSYAVTSDRKALYLTSGTKLYRMDGIRGGEPVEVFGDTIDLLHLALTADDTLYFRSHDALYSCTGDGKATQQLPRCDQLTTTANGILYAHVSTTIYTHGPTGLSPIL